MAFSPFSITAQTKVPPPSETLPLVPCAEFVEPASRDFLLRRVLTALFFYSSVLVRMSSPFKFAIEISLQTSQDTTFYKA